MKGDVEKRGSSFAPFDKLRVGYDGQSVSRESCVVFSALLNLNHNLNLNLNLNHNLNLSLCLRIL
jgi:hypothetical protein